MKRINKLRWKVVFYYFPIIIIRIPVVIPLLILQYFYKFIKFIYRQLDSFHDWYLNVTKPPAWYPTTELFKQIERINNSESYKQHIQGRINKMESKDAEST